MYRGRSVRRPPHGALRVPTGHRVWNSGRDTHGRGAATVPRRGDTGSASGSAHTVHAARRSPDPRSIASRARADPRALPTHKPRGTGSGPDLHCATPTRPRTPAPAAVRSRRSGRVPGGGSRSATAPGAPGNCLDLEALSLPNRVPSSMPTTARRRRPSRSVWLGSGPRMTCRRESARGASALSNPKARVHSGVRRTAGSRVTGS